MLRKLILAPCLVVGLPLSLTAQEAPPGLVLVKGGKTKIGSTVKEIEGLIREFKTVANTLAGETPQHTVDVEDFYLMPNEVTNEQYAEFVRATGHEPPYYWGQAALDAGRAVYLEEQGKARQAAIAAGEKPEDRTPFDAATWWKANWEGKDWEVPADRLDAPVNYVNYYDAEAYAAWAGLRLMSENEYQRAARRNTDNIYPWGDDWDPEACNSLEYKAMDKGMSVGSFEKGAVEGIYDLCANVWEWTTTPYTKYEKYKPLKVKIDNRETVEGLARFDPVARVIVGGAYTAPGHGCRISVRMRAERTQTTEALGFRCATNVNTGSVAANWILQEEVELNMLPSGTEFNPNQALVLQRWSKEKGSAKIADYAVITGYDRTLFCPAAELPADNKTALVKHTSDEGPVVLGVLSFEHPLMEPQLDGGTYYLAWRGAAKIRIEEPEDEGEPTANALIGTSRGQGSTNFWELPGFNAEVDCYFFYDLQFNPVVAWPAPAYELKRLKDGGAVRLDKFVPPTEKPKKDAPPIIPMDTLHFDIVVEGRKRNGLYTTLDLKLQPGTIDDTWK